MPDTTTTAPADADPETPDTGTSEASAEDPATKVIEDYRRRQAGAEKARQEAERARDAALAELKVLQGAKPPKAGDDSGPDLATIKRELEEQFEQRLSKEVAKATGQALDARFPIARGRFPEVTDTVKLAELESLFGEPETAKPVGNNQQRTVSTKSIEDMTRDELKAHMLTFTPADMGLGN